MVIRISELNQKAARYVVQTHSLEQESDETPEQFVLRIVQAFNWCKDKVWNDSLKS